MLRLCYICAMNVQKDRSYAKESTKSKPTGIRFDLEKVEFVKIREKLNTYQKVVDFLLNKFWWEHKIPIVTAKEAPPLHLKSESVVEVPKQENEPQIALKSQIIGLAPKLSDFDKFSEELYGAKSRSEVEAIMKRSVGGIMFPKERFELKAVADKVLEDMFND